MARGERAAKMSNRQYEYSARRPGNGGWGAPKGGPKKGISHKTVTHRKERAQAKEAIARFFKREARPSPCAFGYE